MARDKVELEYIDYRGCYIPHLKYYRNGITVKKGKILDVTQRESVWLMRQKNGNLDCWKLKTKREAKIDMGADNGDRGNS